MDFHPSQHLNEENYTIISINGGNSICNCLFESSTSILNFPNILLSAMGIRLGVYANGLTFVRPLETFDYEQVVY